MRLVLAGVALLIAMFAQLVCCLFFRDGTTPEAGIFGVLALLAAGTCGSFVEQWFRRE